MKLSALIINFKMLLTLVIFLNALVAGQECKSPREKALDEDRYRFFGLTFRIVRDFLMPTQIMHPIARQMHENIHSVQEDFGLVDELKGQGIFPSNMTKHEKCFDYPLEFVTSHYIKTLRKLPSSQGPNLRLITVFRLMFEIQELSKIREECNRFSCSDTSCYLRIKFAHQIVTTTANYIDFYMYNTLFNNRTWNDIANNVDLTKLEILTC